MLCLILETNCNALSNVNNNDKGLVKQSDGIIIALLFNFFSMIASIRVLTINRVEENVKSALSTLAATFFSSYCVS